MRASRQRGAAAVEFALVLPLLMICLWGVVEGGTRYARQTQIDHAAYLAARDLSISPTLTVSSAVTGVYSGTFTIVSPTVACPGDGTTPLAKVTITATRTSISRMFGSYTITGKGVARCEA